MLMKSALADDPAQCQALLHETCKLQSEHDVLMRQTGIRVSERQEKALYSQHDLFSTAFPKVSGLQDFCNAGYQEMIRRLQKTVLDLLKQPVEQRKMKDV